MDLPYPPSPPGVPSDLARPSAAYTRHVAGAVLALLAFLGLYFLLMYWFGHTGWLLVRTGRDSRDGIWAFVAAVPAFLLCAFLAKGLFALRREGPSGDGEVTRADEPALFAFIDRLADEVGAPRPHRVFLSSRVNAAVFYDVSFWNLVVPSKKNLELGLGLVNVLTLDELKAVLAHELGHFAQRSMAVSTWVYTGGRAVAAVVANRDGFDRFLDGLSRVDLRVAWIGWLMRLIVWSVRVLLDTGFRLLTLVERALSREMEFQADLVAVSVTGSDSLLHALRRLGPADDALDRAVAFSMEEAHGGRRVRDLFAVQSEMLAQLRRVAGDPWLGEVPPPPPEGRAAQRLFSPEIAEAPRMWSSHPPNHEREANTKRRYVPSVADPRSAWTLFRDPAAVRETWTQKLYGELYADALSRPAVAVEATRVEVQRAWQRTRYEPDYRGVYVGRSVVIDAASPDALVGPRPADLRAAAAALYPEALVERMKAWQGAETTAALLRALRDGVLAAPGGVIRFQGRDLPRSQLAATVEAAEAERKELRAALAAHDREVRSTHLAMAEQLGQGWPEHLRGHLRLLHHLEHVAADLADAAGALNATFRVVVADGSVSPAELERLLAACRDLHGALTQIYGNAARVVLPADALAHLRVRSWQAELAEELRLGPPTREGLASDWLQAAHSWVRAAGGALGRASAATLDSLLSAEAQVRRAWSEGSPLGEAPPAPAAPERYATMVPGQERPLPRLGWWDRFQVADGVGPGLARLGASAAILGPAVVVTAQIGSADIVVYNGLARPVDVSLGEMDLRLGAGESRRVALPVHDALTVRAHTREGVPIEEFVTPADTPGEDYVYNVAGAEAFAKQWVAYGSKMAPEPIPAGSARWFVSGADYTGEEPPSSISGSRGELRSLLTPLSAYGPMTAAKYAGDSVMPLALAHVQWDPADTEGFAAWLTLGIGLGLDLTPVLDDRLAREGFSVTLARARQDAGGAEACAADRAASAAAPDDADRLYLALRCDDPAPPGAWDAALARFPTHPWIRWGAGWMALGNTDWPRAAELLAVPPPGVGDGGVLAGLRAQRMAGADLATQRAVVHDLRPAAYYEALLVAEEGATAELPEEPEVRREVLRVTGQLAAYRALPELEASDRWAVVCADGGDADLLAWAAEAGPPAPTHYAELCYLAVRAESGELVEGDLDGFRAAQPMLGPVLEPILRAPHEGVVAATQAAAAGTDDPQLRAYAYAVALARLGEEAPAEWRRAARGLLLPWERWAIAAAPT